MKDLVRGIFVTLRSPRQGLRIPVVQQFVKFGTVGVLNTFTTFALYAFFTRVVRTDPLVANPIAFMAAVTVSYTLNKRWTFRDRQQASVQQYTQFALISLVGLLFSELCIFVFHTLLHVNDFVALTVAILFAMIWNFGANRKWTFSA